MRHCCNAVGDFTRLRLRELHELLHRIERRIGLRHQQQRQHRGETHRREAFQRRVFRDDFLVDGHGIIQGRREVGGELGLVHVVHDQDDRRLLDVPQPLGSDG